MVESVRHPPALYWGVISAAALCSVWGTFALAKRSKFERNQRNGRARVNPKVAFKQLRRKYATKLRLFLGDLVYLTMFIIDLLVGVIYWIMDLFLEHRSSQQQSIVISSVLSQSVDYDDLKTAYDAEALHGSQVLQRPPRRGEIKRIRTRWVWDCSNSKPIPRRRCECWGWRVKDLLPEEKLGSNTSKDDQIILPQSQSIELRDEIRNELEDNVVAVGTRSQEGENGAVIRPRWSECHCSQCAPLLMPMRVASDKLYVMSEETYSGKQGELSSVACSASPNPSKSAAGCPSHDVTQGKERTAVIFIHGMFSSATFWFDTDIVSNLSHEVKNQHLILAPDLLGCGRSPRPVDSLYTLTDQIEAIEKSVIQKYKLESFHLVGHSMGSIIALALAARCPRRVRSITLIAPVYPPSCLNEDGEIAHVPCDAFFSFLDPLTLKGIRALTVCKYYNISRLLGHLFYAKHTFWVDRFHNLIGKKKEYPRSFIHDYLTNYHDAAWHIAHNSLLAGTHAVIPALINLRESGHQVLVIHGEIDTSIQFHLAEEMSRTFSNVKLVGVPEKGHVDVVWGRAKENSSLIEKAIRDGDAQWSRSR